MGRTFVLPSDTYWGFLMIGVAPSLSSSRGTRKNPECLGKPELGETNMKNSERGDVFERRNG